MEKEFLESAIAQQIDRSSVNETTELWLVRHRTDLAPQDLARLAGLFLCASPAFFISCDVGMAGPLALVTTAEFPVVAHREVIWQNERFAHGDVPAASRSNTFQLRDDFNE